MKALLVAAFLALVLVSGCASGSQAGSGDGLHSTVPNVQGLQLEPARDKIMNSGYRLGSVSKQAAAGRDSGVVLNQSPAAGVSLPRGGDVNVTVAQ